MTLAERTTSGAAPTSLTDPSRDVRDRVAGDSGVIEDGNKIWFHKTAAAVIDAGRCVRCGTCIASCPSGSIGIGSDGLPTLVRMCTGCSSCWDFCPLAGLCTPRLQRLWERDTAAAAAAAPARTPAPTPAPALGRVLAAYEARARRPVAGQQDGGVATALLAALVDQGEVQGVLLSHRHSPLLGETVLARTADEVRRGAGSVYHQSYPLARIARSLPAGVDSVAMIGTPCQVSGLRALQRFPWRYRQAPVERVTLAIALFCTRSFDPQRLTVELVRLGLDLGRTAKVDVRDGLFRAFDGDGATIFQTHVGSLDAAGLRGCEECADFSGAVADISLGNVGSRPGSTTVLIRTARGAEAWQRAASALEAAPLADLSAVATMADRNARRAARVSRRPSDPDAGLWLSYTEYLTAVLGTDRAPVAPPAHRSHHYTVAC